MSACITGRGSLSRGGERYLTAILPQLGRDECQPDLLMDFLCNPPPAGKQALFIGLPAAMNRKAAQRARRADLDVGAQLLLKRETVTAGDFPAIRSVKVATEPPRLTVVPA